VTVDATGFVFDANNPYFVDSQGLTWILNLNAGDPNFGNPVPSASTYIMYESSNCTGTQFYFVAQINNAPPTNGVYSSMWDERKRATAVYENSSSTGNSINLGSFVPLVRPHVISTPIVSQWTTLQVVGQPPSVICQQQPFSGATGYTYYGWDLSEVQSITPPNVSVHFPLHYELR
jgi:hypothetical protein